MATDERGRTVVEECVVPALHGRAFVVAKGQTLRIEEVEGKQVVDATFQNADNLRETFHAGQSMALNMLGGTGNLKRVRYLYSRPPYENVLMTVTDVGDYIELRAEMNVLVGISACPNDQDDVNAGTPKPLGVKILAA